MLAISLYVWLLVLVWQWEYRIRSHPRPFASYGLTGNRQFYQELLFSLGAGFISLLLVFGLEGVLGWIDWQPIQLQPFLIAWVTGLALGLGVGLVEELLFRGWLLNELRLDYGRLRAAGIVALFFALTHFLKPLDLIIRTWPQFPGLVAMGWVLVQARSVRGERLGMPMGLHAGWVWGISLVNSLGWIRYTGSVPEWLTGIGGNPLAGLLGILFMVATSLGLRWVPADPGGGALDGKAP